MNRDEETVYSTEKGRLCPTCHEAVAECRCGEREKQHSGSKDGIIRLRRETKGRKGKGVTVISGLPLGDADLQKLAKQLKQKCGAGGSVKDGEIEIQGEHRTQLKTELEKLGYRTKG